MMIEKSRPDNTNDVKRYVPECCGMDLAEQDEVERGAAYVKETDFLRVCIALKFAESEIRALQEELGRIHDREEDTYDPA